ALGFAGCEVLIFAFYLISDMFNSKYSLDNMEYCTPYATRNLGVIYTGDSTKNWNKIDAFIDKKFSRNGQIRRSAAESGSLVGANINNVLINLDIKNAAVVSTFPTDRLEPIIEILGCDCKCVGDITASVDSCNQLEAFSCAVIAAMEGIDTMDSIRRQCELLLSWNKTIIGVVTIK
ncbi:MAG: hypothetical protein MJ186_05840, partial [Clostridia bacterium]|nr:hypothetical protein [Clostridia bacterium]